MHVDTHEDINVIIKDNLLVPSFQTKFNSFELFELQWGYTDYIEGYPKLKRSDDK